MKCEFEGKCHGCLKWCEFCGNVGHLCDMKLDDCYSHPVCKFPFCQILNCYDHESYDPVESCKQVLDS